MNQNDIEIVERYEDYIGIKYRTQGGETTEMVYVNPCLEKAIANVIKEYTKLKAERDKAVEDMKSICHTGSGMCEFCKSDCIDAGSDCDDTFQCGCFEWRGLEE